ncbi:MAG: hypothetical protein HYV04_13310 [Deltaproteobacteria bacterium]|nr:hypothetical protein [Deltaproteobacteria bacterium]
MDLMLLGSIALASLIAGLFFLRFWKDTGDRFFLFFAISFFVEGMNRAALGLSGDPNEGRPLFYFVRFLSFVLILIAIVHKNLTKSTPAKPTKGAGMRAGP